MPLALFLSLLFIPFSVSTALAGEDRWTSIGQGPPNPGLASDMAVAPSDPEVLYVGSIADYGIFRSADSGQTWERFKLGEESLYPGIVRKLVVDPGDPNVVYAEGHLGMLKSVDGGRTWALLPDSAIDLAIAPGNPQVLYNGHRKSEDGGQTWKPMNFPGGSNPVSAIHPTDENIVFTSTHRSADGGQTWSPIRPGNRSPYKYVFAPNNPDTVYAATSEGVVRSTDSGATWGTPWKGMKYVTDLAIDPEDPSTLYVIAGQWTQGGIFFTADSGATWKVADEGMVQLTKGAQYSRKILAQGKGRLLVMTGLKAETGMEDPYHGFIFQRERDGRTWSQLGGETLQLPENRAFSYGRAGDRGLLIYSTNNYGLFRSRDLGHTWTTLFQGPVLQVAVDPQNGEYLYAYVRTYPSRTSRKTSLLRSRNAGDTWENTQLADSLISHIAVQLGAPENLYASSWDGKFYYSTDGGQQWRFHNYPEYGISTFFVNPSDFKEIHAFRYGGSLHSADGGRTWDSLDVELDTYNLGMAWSPSDPRIAYLGFHRDNDSYPQGKFIFYRSLDSGQTWSAFETAAGFYDLGQSLVVHPRVPRVLYSPGYREVITSRDGGLTWRSSGPEELGERVVEVFFDPADAQQLYAATLSGIYAMHLSQDPLPLPDPQEVSSFDTLAPQGTWRHVLEKLEVTSLAQDSQGRIWFAGQHGNASPTEPTVGVLTKEKLDTLQLPEEVRLRSPTQVSLDAQDRLWLNGILTRFDGQTWESFAPELTREAPVDVVLARRNGEVWFGWSESCGSSDGGTFRLDGNEAVRASTENLARPGTTNAMVEDDQGTMWIGTGRDVCHSSQSIGGLSSYDGTRWRYYGVGNGLAHPYVLDIALGKEGVVWLATAGGLTRFERGEGLSYTTGNSALVDDYVRAVAVDSNGAVWAGTPTGLSRFDGVHWTTYHHANGLLGNAVSDLLVDPQNRIWAANRAGIFVLDNGQVPSVVQTETPGPLPLSFALLPNYPNPFNPQTAISYQLPQTSPVKLTLYNIAGQPVRRLVDQVQAAGTYQVTWDGADQTGRAMSSGVYLYRLEAGTFQQTRQLVLVK